MSGSELIAVGELPMENSDKKKIYLDLCTLCRPFDDQDMMRIRLETDAYYLIVQAIQDETYEMMVSPVHFEEVNAIEELQERYEILSFLQTYGVRAPCNPSKVRARTEYLYSIKFGLADAAHVAFAEGTSDFFVSCDERLLKKCERHHADVSAMNPVEFSIREGLR
ncbi:MAG: hypothetical protein V1800_15510 [Candidatus Latescibacterota bacterium]